MKKCTDYISASQIKQFLFCPLAYKYGYVDGIKGKGNEYTAYGSAVHKALQLNFEQKITSGKDLPSREVIDLFEKEFSKIVQEENIFIDSLQGSIFIQAGALTLESYITKIAPTIDPLYCEKKFEVTLKNYPIKILAYVDLITKDDRIIDFKTVGKTWKQQYSKNKVLNDVQVTIYSALFRKVFKKQEKSIEFHILPRGSSECEIIVTDRTEEQIKQVLELATAIEVSIEKGLLIPNIANCPSCAYKDICPKLAIY